MFSNDPAADAFVADVSMSYERLTDDVIADADFVFGSIEDMGILLKRFEKKMSYWNLKVSEFLPCIKEEYVNFKGCYKQVCQLDRDDAGKFCRSDSGDKAWSGQILDDGMIQIIKNRMLPDDLMYLAPRRSILCEARYWIKDERIVASSPYVGGPSCLIWKDILDAYVEKIVGYWGPDEMYTVDVGMVDGAAKVIEYNCWSTSGFYEADLKAIMEATVGRAQCPDRHVVKNDS